jgi:hypothetical protein
MVILIRRRLKSHSLNLAQSGDSQESDSLLFSWEVRNILVSFVSYIIIDVD